MTDNAREAILSRVRNALRTAYLPIAGPVTLPPPSRRTAGRDEIVDRFIRELADLDVTCHREDDEPGVRNRVSSLTSGKRILAWEPDRLPYGLGEALRFEELISGSEPKDAKERAEIGLTGVQAAVAETGSLVVFSSGGRPRTASLLPPVHLAIVRPEDIVPSLEAFIQRIDPRNPDSPNITVITGPSRTADIELSITLGVHGPGDLTVVIGP